MVAAEVDRDLFYKLASDLSEERLQATIALVTQLSDVEKDSREWEYVLNRLIKGLASSRNGARLGFCLCLTEVVASALEKNVLAHADDYLCLLLSTLSRENIKNGKEERGLLFGKLFGLQVLLNEPLFSQVFKDGNEVNLDFTLTYVSSLIDVALAKTWIRESSMYTLYQVIEKLSSGISSKKPLKALLTLLDSRGLTQTSEGLAVYLFLLHKCPTTASALRKKGLIEDLKLSSPWKNNDPLSKGNLPAITNALKEINSSEDYSVKQKGVWMPRLHFVWDIILTSFFEASDNEIAVSEPAKKKRKKSPEERQHQQIKFPEFWKSVVDESFFNEKSSSERKYLGFLVFEKAFSMAPASYALTLLSKNLIRCLINQSGSSERNLHKVSQRALTTIIEVCKNQPEKTSPSFETLALKEYGSINFDQLTKSKTLNILLSCKSLTAEHLVLLGDVLTNHLLASLKDHSRVRYLLDAMLHLVRAHKSAANKVWLAPLLDALIQQGFFEPEDNERQAKVADQDPPINNLAIERLYSILADLVSAECKSETLCWPYVAVEIILFKLKSQKLLSTMDEELTGILNTSINTLQTIGSKAGKGEVQMQIRGLQLIFSVNILQAYSGETDSILVLQDLNSFYETLREKKDSSYAGFIEILLSLAAQKKALLRKASLLVWELFVGEVSQDDISVLLEILPARENKEGFSKLFEGEEDEGGSGEEEASDGLSAEEGTSGDDGEEDESGPDSDEQGSEDTGQIDKEATSALAKALNLPESIVNDNGEVQFEDLGDTEDEEVSDEDLDDEKMMELDGQLSEIFKRRKEALSKIPTGNKRKQEVKESRENVIAFKHRVVDMLEIFVRWAEGELKQGIRPETSIASKIISITLPLISCVRTTLDKALAEKVTKLLKNKICKLKFVTDASFDNLEEKLLENNLKSVHEAMLLKKCGQFQNLYFSACSTASIFLAKLFVQKSPRPETYFKLTEIYHKTLNEWFIGGRFSANLFLEFLNWLSLKKQQYSD
ncbi:LAQU0S03e09780g1_1 [Lachancea quebecensis]|uniref:LAQU0S03e09780g1_1 n=1 Tax=Lachancea quebecensis TaxID=1654605 RepID=A0A0P1KPL7_9SACH|nr:LAQU0S03e09780g1_1 [Lachancea quebecensis]